MTMRVFSFTASMPRARSPASYCAKFTAPPITSACGEEIDDARLDAHLRAGLGRGARRAQIDTVEHHAAIGSTAAECDVTCEQHPQDSR